jgi:hypothetical protein
LSAATSLNGADSAVRAETERQRGKESSLHVEIVVKEPASATIRNKRICALFFLRIHSSRFYPKTAANTLIKLSEDLLELIRRPRSHGNFYSAALQQSAVVQLDSRDSVQFAVSSKVAADLDIADNGGFSSLSGPFLLFSICLFLPAHCVRWLIKTCGTPEG